MARYETANHSNTDFFRWHATYDGKDDYSGEYHTLKNVRAGVAYDQKIKARYYPEVVVTYKIQKLTAVPCFTVGTTERPEGQFHDIGATLVWEDIDG